MSPLSLFLPPQACAGADPELLVQRVTGPLCEPMPFAQAIPKTDQVWRLVLPVEAVTVCAVALPITKARWLAKALPFAVEELLAEDVEQFHLCVGEVLADGRHRVYAVRRAWLSAWLALCAGNPPQRIEVDADLLVGEGTQLLCMGERWLLGGSGDVRLALRPQDWPQLAEQCPTPRMAHVDDEQVGPIPVDECQQIGQPFVWLAQQRAPGNLAQGEFARREASSGLQAWRPLLALAGLWLLLQWGFNLVQGWQLEREAQRYAEANEALYHELFPEDRKLINLRAQFDQHLGESGDAGGGRLLGLLGQAAVAINAENGQVQVEQLDYSAQRGDLAFSLQARDFAALERLRTQLQEAGVVVEMGSASREDDGVSARLVIGGNG